MNSQPKSPPPNIVILYADDLGFGDVGCYGATRLSTPNIDRLAARGIKFHRGYATAATCTPSRYSLLTGSYPWRNPRAAILRGDAPILFDPAMRTLPGMLRSAGYRTGVVGKWHLGLGNGDLDWNRKIAPSPNEVGFDHSFIMPATNDRVPCVYVENGSVAGLDPADPIEVTYDEARAFPGQPTGRRNPERLRMKFSHGHDGTIVNGVSRIGFMKGGASALWTDETMADVFLREAVDFITESKDRPFFLYYAFHQPHVPRLPGPRYHGATRLGPRGDVIAEMDGCVGGFLDALDRLGLRENTLVIFSSDNGPVLDDGYEDQAAERTGSHRPAGPLRGGKNSLFDGGTRVPFLLSWPGTVAPGDSDALVSHVDFHASFAALTDQPLGPQDAPDSLDLLDALLGKSGRGRTEMVVEGNHTKRVFRRDDWVFIPPHPGPPVHANTGTELGNSPAPQLYDLRADIGQIRDLAPERGDLVNEMALRLESILRSERTRG